MYFTILIDRQYTDRHLDVTRRLIVNGKRWFSLIVNCPVFDMIDLHFCLFLLISGEVRMWNVVHTAFVFIDEECGTPCTYTECILSVFLSGIPSVYVTGGYTDQRWTSRIAVFKFSFRISNVAYIMNVSTKNIDILSSYRDICSL